MPCWLSNFKKNAIGSVSVFNNRPTRVSLGWIDRGGGKPKHDRTLTAGETEGWRGIAQKLNQRSRSSVCGGRMTALPRPSIALCAAGNRSIQRGTIPIECRTGSIDRSIRAMCMPAILTGTRPTKHHTDRHSVQPRAHRGCPGPPSTAAAACRRWSCRTRRSAAEACTVSSRPLRPYLSFHPVIHPSFHPQQPPNHPPQASRGPSSSG